MKIRLPLAAFSLFMMAAPSSAHHGIASVFDLTKTVNLTGTVTRVFWANPHVYVLMDVADPQKGKPQEWMVELPPPNALFRAGTRASSFKVQDVLKVTGYPAKPGADLSYISLGSGTFNVPAPTPAFLLNSQETTLQNGTKVAIDEGTQHHSFANQYDNKSKQTLTGMVTDLWWANPHSSMVLQVRSANGRDLESWTVELPSASAMAFKGLTKDSVKAGDRVVVTGATGRNVAHTLLMQTATFPNGVTLAP